jgi:hypothetical protein
MLEVRVRIRECSVRIRVRVGARVARVIELEFG